MSQWSRARVAVVEQPLLEEIVDESRGSAPRTEANLPLVGECLDVRHPVLAARIQVRWVEPDGDRVEERWLPTLQGLPVRVGDRVLLQQPANWNEPVVIGVVDGFARRPEVPKQTAATMSLLPDEAIRITTREGAPLLELSTSEGGPVVRLLTSDVAVEMPGHLRLEAQSIALRASAGEVKIEASADVRIEGETINLN